MNKLFTLLTLLLCVASSAWADEETISLVSYTVSNNTAILTSTSGKLTIELSRPGGTLPSPASNDRGLRWQKNCVVSVGVSSGYKINSVKVITGKNGNSTSNIAFTLTDGTNALSGTWDNSLTGNKQYDYTWTATVNTYYASWVLTNTGDSGDLYISSITVSYEAATVQNAAPTIVTQPESEVDAYVGFETELTVGATGYPAPTYQWYENSMASNEGGTAIDGATNATYTFTPATVGTYYYYAVATNMFDDEVHTATSNVATVTVGTKYSVNFVAGNSGATVSIPPAEVFYPGGTEITLPTNHYFYLDGNSVEKWSDGENEYDLGAAYLVNSNVTFYPVFSNNTKTLGSQATTITWTFSRTAGAPQYAIEGNGKTTTVVGTTANGIDLAMDVALSVNPDNSSQYGKFNNGSYTDRAQVNAYTSFTIPAVKGMTVTYVGTSGTAALADAVTFGGEQATSVTGSTYTYEYTGENPILTIADLQGCRYPSGISVTYPEPKTKYDAPIITIGDFNFENKGYVVTITKADGDNLMVSTDGSSYTAQTSPYVTYASTTTHYYAKVTGSSLDDSDVADENVTSTFDDGKSYVAWIYESNYENKPKNYNVANDEIYKALNAIYNVVLVDIKDYKSATDEQKAALNGNLDDADLVVISEAAAGGSKAVIGLKDIVGSVPMVNMKFYAYSSGRWEWGTPNNPGSDKTAMSVASKGYKVLNGVTFEADGTVSLFEDTASQNHIQTVKSWSAAPEGNVEMATVSVTSGETTTQEVAMHASNSKKFFGIGLSCDDYNNYSDNAVTIIKNAAAILIAGDDITAINEAEDPVAEGDVVTLTTTATMAGWRAFYDADNSYTVDENTKVYVATEENEGNVSLKEYAAGVPAATPVILKTNASAENDGTFKMTLTKTTETITLTYTGESLLKVTPFEGNWYRLGSKNGEVGFFPFNATGAAAGIVVLNIDSSNAGARGLTFSFADDETTAIQNVNGNDNVNKNVYDLQGRRVAKPTKGMYIVNGKKVIIK